MINNSRNRKVRMRRGEVAMQFRECHSRNFTLAKQW